LKKYLVLFLSFSNLGIPIEIRQVSDVRRLLQEVGESFLQMQNQHAKLGAPVPDMIQPVHL